MILLEDGQGIYFWQTSRTFEMFRPMAASVSCSLGRKRKLSVCETIVRQGVEGIITHRVGQGLMTSYLPLTILLVVENIDLLLFRTGQDFSNLVDAFGRRKRAM